MNSKFAFNSLDSTLLYKSDLLKRIFFTLMALVCYRLGTYVPIPGINLDIINDIFPKESSGVFGVFNLFSGGALARMTILALNVMPYIVASIVMQLLSSAVKGINEIKNDGELGRRKMNSYIRYMTIVFCIFQSITILIGLERMNREGVLVVVEPGIMFRTIGVFSLLGGTIFLIWLGERISVSGIGNGISLIIFTGITSELHNALSSLLTLNKNGSMSFFITLFVIALFFLLLLLVIFTESSYRKVIVQYPKKQFKKLHNDDFTYIPLKINLSGVIPTIFANAILLTPISIANFYKGHAIADFILNYFMANKVMYIITYLILIVLFNFFYTNFIFNPEENADFLRKNGGFIPGRGPGKHTSDYLQDIVFKLTFIGSAYLVVICTVPEIMRYHYDIPFIFGGTSLLIIVNVITDTIMQVQSYVFSNRYDSWIKKYESKTRRLK
ncbi:preprotein translocase, SecY subunit [Wolbachia endosymbiont of Culex quinquefasciatus JHB]|uniref:Protein translocase subunit SecY n=1 Tax=Wolbachia endosymbiont of Ephestia elutella TaxID=3231696 RepID=A0AAU8MMP0_9RICK|nr:MULTISPECIES: preprotein translocase subunit SecY [unclassified Wolbachia]EEB55717.1 preprotein translocase, SecY subunit [Wolbachia endosymbiont of Culex quinquefasciatus JHB]CAQ55293.1 preprotein translocase, SecY subunit [Wolbachia endosymbiont of Culex quinquefasciatus Pel]